MTSTIITPRPRGRPDAPGIRPRADIQGLRMLAVVVVVLFHLWPGLLPGGFVGVDVFFVISGYLVTRIITAETVMTGSFRPGRFFARRARRLLPGAGAALAATMVAGFVILPTTSWERLGTDTLASVLQLENWNLVVSKTDYLHPAEGVSPVQNFWSLSVEWQDYLIWALLVGVLFSRVVTRPAVARTIMLVVTGLSLGASAVLSARHPGFAYFGTPTRLWEFGAGAVAALWSLSMVSRPRREILGWAGITAIALSAVVFNGSTPFPGVAAVLPVSGALAIVVAGEHRGASSWAWLLSRAVPVYLGDRSYAIYLWHWPVLILIGAAMSRSESAKVTVVAAAATVALAIISTRLVERPVRTSRHPRRVAAALALWVVLPLLLGGGAVAQAANARAALQASADAAHPGAAALAGTARGTAPIVPAPQAAAADYGPAGVGDLCLHVIAVPVSCTFGDVTSDRLVDLAGDSHAWQWIPALDLLGKRAGFRVQTLVHPSCPLAQTGVDIPGIGDDGTCTAWRRAAISQIVAEHPVAVIVGGLTPAGYEAIEYHVASTAQFVAGYRALWQTFAAAGVPVVAMRDDPYFSSDVPPCVASNLDHPAACDESRASVLDAYPDPLVAATGPGARLVDLTDSICRSTVCPAVVGNVLVYRDRDHLTATYARTLAPMLWAQLATAAPFDRMLIG